ncbi:hypothetical protein M514_27718 [Trichuris suis]|uniref:Integrase catalytic domain-containing protein n=1 Tax=Trichuris suis TaxID=68888 RepID=A0A085MSA6_9BILA|nr:hypothetical protein M514_27718 [Trichuris suis]
MKSRIVAATSEPSDTATTCSNTKSPPPSGATNDSRRSPGHLCNEVCSLFLCLVAQPRRRHRTPPEVPFFSWNMPSEPWARLDVGLSGLNWLVIVDAYSKWLDMIPLSKRAKTNIIKHCRRLFATFDLPRYIVSDNGPQFVSEEFAKFCRSSNIVHTLEQ